MSAFDWYMLIMIVAAITLAVAAAAIWAGVVVEAFLSISEDRRKAEEHRRAIRRDGGTPSI